MSGEQKRRKGRGSRAVIRASEIGAYVYCRRAWWLKRVAEYEQQGRTEVLEAGVSAHARHGRTVRRSQWQRQIALGLFVGGLLLIGLAGFSLLILK